MVDLLIVMYLQLISSYIVLFVHVFQHDRRRQPSFTIVSTRLTVPPLLHVPSSPFLPLGLGNLVQQNLLPKWNRPAILLHLSAHNHSLLTIPTWGEPCPVSEIIPVRLVLAVVVEVVHQSDIQINVFLSLRKLEWQVMAALLPSLNHFPSLRPGCNQVCDRWMMISYRVLLKSLLRSHTGTVQKALHANKISSLKR